MRITLTTVATTAALAGLLSACGGPQAAPRVAQPQSATPYSSASASAAPAPSSSAVPAPLGVNTRLGITGAQMARQLSPDGSAQAPTTSFNSAGDRRIIAVVSLANLPAGTRIRYVRSLDGKFVDSRIATLAKTSRYVYFEFDAAPGKVLVPGHYRLRLELNAAPAGEVLYEVV